MRYTASSTFRFRKNHCSGGQNLNLNASLDDLAVIVNASEQLERSKTCQWRATDAASRPPPINFECLPEVAGGATRGIAVINADLSYVENAAAAVVWFGGSDSWLEQWSRHSKTGTDCVTQLRA